MLAIYYMRGSGGWRKLIWRSSIRDTMREKFRTMGCHLLLWVGCSWSSNDSEFLGEHNKMDYGGLRGAFHVGGDRNRLFSFQREMSSALQLHQAQARKEGQRARLKSSSLSCLAGRHVHGGERWGGHGAELVAEKIKIQ
jgi:hypothetical protein